ncbi:MAG: aldo/keto reductase [Coriobacteriaceae bacterium]|nr:MAG: aldo/keto reductase [Coriobacteriaceae bacterium]
MRYKYCENMAMQLSSLGVGTWSMAGRNAYGLVFGRADEARPIETLRALLDEGVNVIDTAPIYGMDSAAEKLVGKALQDDYREKVFLVTKFGDYCNAKTGAREIDDSREDILCEIEGSLERLKTDHIDLYLMHYPDEKAPVKETMDTLNTLLEEGKISHIGVSNVSVPELEECMRYAKIDAVELRYSMVDRQCEEAMKWAHGKGLATLTYGTLGGGILTGAFRTLPHFEEKDIRYTFYTGFKEPLFSKVQKLLSDMDTVAVKHGRPVSQVVLAWTMQKEFVTTALVGCSSPKRAHENCDATTLGLTADEISFLDSSIERNLS